MRSDSYGAQSFSHKSFRGLKTPCSHPQDSSKAVNMLGALGFPGCRRAEPPRLLPVGSGAASQRQDFAGVDIIIQVPLRDVTAL